MHTTVIVFLMVFFGCSAVHANEDASKQVGWKWLVQYSYPVPETIQRILDPEILSEFNPSMDLTKWLLTFGNT